MKQLMTDEQTITDLRLFSHGADGGLAEIYNHTTTRGGGLVLQTFLRNPLSEAEAIEQRIRLISGFACITLPFPVEPHVVNVVEKYLTQPRGQHAPDDWNERDHQQGVMAVLTLLQQTREFLGLVAVKEHTAYGSEYTALMEILDQPALRPALAEPLKAKPSFAVVTAFDRLFREQERSAIVQVLEKLYLLDVYLGVARAANEKGFVFPEVSAASTPVLTLKGLYHPVLMKAVGNDVRLDAENNVLFLTGANMAGKSTFLRALATALYMAHIGFPVAATHMRFSVMDGIFTTINLPDNLGMGASHFYAEVLRLKQLTEEVCSGKTMLLIFDELFRGTNVKDAHEATVAVTERFTKRNNALFVLSSHIVEAGEDLKTVPGMVFRYLPTQMEGGTPVYTYRLEKGISADRHGMVIIRNEGILDMLKNGKKRQ